MNSKKVSKIISVILIAIMLISVTSIVFADEISLDPSSIKGTTSGGASKAQQIGGKILGIVQVVGSIVAVIILAVLGIKYMMGSAEEKAEYKKTFIPYIIGAILVFAASNLASVVYNFAKDLNNNQ